MFLKKILVIIFVDESVYNLILFKKNIEKRNTSA